jgi:hypothetical protein
VSSSAFLASKTKPSLRRQKGVQGQLRTVTTAQWRISAEKYKPGMCFTYGNRDHWSNTAAQNLKNIKDKYHLATLMVCSVIYVLIEIT